MDETRRRVAVTLAGHAEDIALASGAVLLSAGTGTAFGYAFGLMAAGTLLIVYGAWITGRRP